MAHSRTLENHLDRWAFGGAAGAAGAASAAVATIVASLARTATRVAKLIAGGRLSGDFGTIVGATPEGDAQKALDVQANELFLDGLQTTPVAVLGSEENDEPICLNKGAPFAIAIDPLDGSSNVDTNISVGTIFSIMPTATTISMAAADRSCPLEALLQPGSRQVAAGFFVYGPQTVLVLTVGEGTQIFTLDRASDRFLLTHERVVIPDESSEYAINASNCRHWNQPIRSYINDCVAGADGPRGKDFNMRWLASVVAEAFRILMRGGIYLYPGDARPGYAQGRLRLVYEANPIACLIEQAGGAATDGEHRILDLTPDRLHQRVPLVFGSSSKVDRVARYHVEPPAASETSPLFGDRGLFQVR
ncbi:MAG: class 1 fructose-bisphosphatase [Alphaproteobacteria bacterium]|nr:class 1 fructose-bisphosphatase [Alphaproteobacteria bacterium]